MKLSFPITIVMLLCPFLVVADHKMAASQLRSLSGHFSGNRNGLFTYILKTFLGFQEVCLVPPENPQDFTTILVHRWFLQKFLDQGSLKGPCSDFCDELCGKFGMECMDETSTCKNLVKNITVGSTEIALEVTLSTSDLIRVQIGNSSSNVFSMTPHGVTFDAEAEAVSGIKPGFTSYFREDHNISSKVALIAAEFLMLQLAAAANLQSGTGSRRLDSPGCDWFPDTKCTLECCASHDFCYDYHKCTASSWIRVICERFLLTRFESWVGPIYLPSNPYAALVCTPSLFFDRPECNNCNNVALDCIVKTCSSFDEGRGLCYDNKCNKFFSCPDGECECRPFACNPPESCGNQVCEGPDENAENCHTDCWFQDHCFLPVARRSLEYGSVDLLKDHENCGCCNLPCPDALDCVLGRCSLPFSIDWEVSQSGVLADGGWKISNDGKTIRYVVEDSENCGGKNDEVQSGLAEATIIVPSKYELTAEIIGVAELEASGFEVMSVFLDGITIVEATSNGKNLDCEMGPAIVSFLVPMPTVIAPGQHTFSISFTTNDSLYHVGSFYELNLIFAPIDG